MSSIIPEIIDVFKDKFKLRLSELYKHFEEIKDSHPNGKHLFRQKLILFALNRIISNKIHLTNIYGYRCYLVEDKGMLFTQTEYPSQSSTGISKYDTTYYNQHLVSILRNDISMYIFKEAGVEQGKLLDKFAGMIPGSIELDRQIDSLPVVNKIMMIEEAVHRRYIQKREFTYR